MVKRLYPDPLSAGRFKIIRGLRLNRMIASLSSFAQLGKGS
jgi:hypothetical protein